MSYRQIRRRADRQLKALFERAAGARRRVDGVGQVVALTFDDGPDPVYTPRVLDHLAELGVPATFFVVGHKAERHPALVRRMVEQGCSVGSHSATHPDPRPLSIRALVDEYRRGAASVDGVIGTRTRRFRPPQGRVGRRGAAAIRASGLRPWLWSVDTQDWKPTATSEEIVGVGSAAGPGDIVLLHDGIEGAPDSLDRSATVASIGPLVTTLRNRGLTFIALP